MVQNSLPVDVVVRYKSGQQSPVIFETNFGLDEDGVAITGKVLLTSDTPAAEFNPRYRIYNDDGDLLDSDLASGYTPGEVNVILVWKTIDTEAVAALAKGRYTVEIDWEVLVTGEAEKRSYNGRTRLYVDY